MLQCITDQEGVVVATNDYLCRDDDDGKNNALWQTISQEQSRICGVIVTTVSISQRNEIRIELDNGIRIETCLSNGRFCNAEIEQWCFFRRHDHASPYISVYQNSVDIAEEW